MQAFNLRKNEFNVEKLRQSYHFLEKAQQLLDTLNLSPLDIEVNMSSMSKRVLAPEISDTLNYVYEEYVREQEQKARQVHVLKPLINWENFATQVKDQLVSAWNQFSSKLRGAQDYYQSFQFLGSIKEVRNILFKDLLRVYDDLDESYPHLSVHNLTKEMFDNLGHMMTQEDALQKNLQPIKRLLLDSTYAHEFGFSGLEQYVVDSESFDDQFNTLKKLQNRRDYIDIDLEPFYEQYLALHRENKALETHIHKLAGSEKSLPVELDAAIRVFKATQTQA